MASRPCRRWWTRSTRSRATRSQGLAVRAARGEGACDGGSLGVEVGAGTEHRGWTTMRVVVDDPFDARLLDRLQTDLPLVPRPWAALADALDSDEAHVIERVQALRDARVVRQVSAIFDTRR